MWPSREVERQRIANALADHSKNVRTLAGINNSAALGAVATQFIASLRREDYYRRVQDKAVASEKANPNSGRFDAERAVAYHLQQGSIEEAAWLVFLMTHFARPADSGWLRLQQIYGALGSTVWDWATVREDPDAMSEWLSKNWTKIGGKFGNHRKYESLRPDADRSFSTVLKSYLNWIGPDGHERFFSAVVKDTGNDPSTIFDALYKDLAVTSFGRLAKFDYLSLIGRYGIAPIKAGSAYLAGATGPAAGARLLFLGSRTAHGSVDQLQAWLDELDSSLHVGMIVMEDALCNWQKSPEVFVHYKG